MDAGMWWIIGGSVLLVSLPIVVALVVLRRGAWGQKR